MRFAILTDLHCVPPGETLYGLDPLANLRAAVATLNRDHPGLDFVVLLGDLTQGGEPAAYQAIAEALAELRAPVIPMTGNHDARDAMRAALPQTDRDPQGFVQALRVFDDASVLTLDTLDEGGTTSAGVLCVDRLAFLEAKLAEAPADRPLLLFQHHPPFATGIAAMDRIRLTNADAELAVLERVRRPDYLFLGHVHRPITALWQGIPCHIQRGLSHQVALDFSGGERLMGSYEAPDYAVVTADRAGIVIHGHPVRLAEPLYDMRDPAAQARPRR